MKKLLLLISLFSISLFVQRANAQCHRVGNGTGGGILCMYADSTDSLLYLGGGFHNSGSDSLHFCGYWDDTSFHHMGMGTYGTNDSVWCFTMFNGNTYVGGSFTQANGVSANHIAMWDGTSWHAVGSGFNDAVHALCVYKGELYAGGEFTMAGSTSINHLAKWDGIQWVQVGSGTNDDVETLCVWDTSLYIGGDFTMAGTTTVNHICRWDGSNFFAVGSGFTNGMMMDCMIHTLCVYNGHLYAGGMFNHADGVGMHNLAMWDGTSWTSVGDVGSGGGSDIISAMCVYDSALYIGGNFNSCNSHASNNIGVWNGSSWSTIGTGMNGSVHALAVYKNYLYIAGSFTDADGTAVSNIAKYAIPTGIQPVTILPTSLNVYPNPATDFVTCRWVQHAATTVIVNAYNIEGKQVLNQNLGTLSSGSHEYLIPLGNWGAGVYFVNIVNGTEKFQNKIVVTK